MILFLNIQYLFGNSLGEASGMLNMFSILVVVVPRFSRPFENPNDSDVESTFGESGTLLTVSCLGDFYTLCHPSSRDLTKCTEVLSL